MIGYSFTSADLDLNKFFYLVRRNNWSNKQFLGNRGQFCEGYRYVPDKSKYFLRSDIIVACNGVKHTISYKNPHAVFI